MSFALFLALHALAGAGATDVSPVTVMPKTDPPALVSTWPAAGQAIAPGVLIMRISFDQQMLAQGFNFTPVAGAEAPDCLKTPRLLNDNKSFVLLCRTAPGKAYAIAFNAAPTGGFANVGENRARPAQLAFTTTADAPVRNLDDAVKAAGLTGLDTPVQDTPNLPPAPQPAPGRSRP